jgi:membrane-associated phospholipid phosphatase
VSGKMSIEILRKILEIGNINIAFYLAYIVFILTNNFRFVLSFLSSVAITGFLKIILQPYSPSGHMAMATIILIWASFLSNKLLTFIACLGILSIFAYALIETNSHTISETVFGFLISSVCFFLFVIF